MLPATRLRHRRFLESAALVAACVASGSLECGGPQSTVAERRGADTYRRMCSVCHGAEGQGYKADQATALAHPAFLSSVSDGFLRRAITEGRAGTTMSAWGQGRGGPLTAADVESLIEILHSWQSVPRAALDEAPAGGDAGRGESTFARECARCHGPKGTGGPYVNIGNPDFLATAGNGFLRFAVRSGRSGTAMPAFGAALGAQGVEDVVAWLRSLRAPPTQGPRAAPARVPPLPLGPVPLNPRGPEPIGFRVAPATTPADTVRGQLDRGAKMALLDARAPSDYANEHVAGAVSVPFYDIEPYASALPHDAWLVCYCACPHAESGQLAQKLLAKGFTKVTVLDEGLGVWKSRHYGTQTGWDP
jgi:cytochrome c oxidase cbb3-type subunit 3/ubiquinol-cytochrome c reductase cytochrome c subunit